MNDKFYGKENLIVQLYFMYVDFHNQAAIRSTSWRGNESEPNSGNAFNADSGGPPPRLERSKSTQSSVSCREHPSDSATHSGLRRFAGLNANVSWDEDNLPEWYDSLTNYFIEEINLQQKQQTHKYQAIHIS